jgi:hypothetical protein
VEVVVLGRERGSFGIKGLDSRWPGWYAPPCQPALVNGAPAAIELVADPAVLRAFTVAESGSPA